MKRLSGWSEKTTLPVRPNPAQDAGECPSVCADTHRAPVPDAVSASRRNWGRGRRGGRPESIIVATGNSSNTTARWAPGFWISPTSGRSPERANAITGRGSRRGTMRRRWARPMLRRQSRSAPTGKARNAQPKATPGPGHGQPEHERGGVAPEQGNPGIGYEEGEQRSDDNGVTDARRPRPIQRRASTGSESRAGRRRSSAGKRMTTSVGESTSDEELRVSPQEVEHGPSQGKRAHRRQGQRHRQPGRRTQLRRLHRGSSAKRTRVAEERTCSSTVTNASENRPELRLPPPGWSSWGSLLPTSLLTISSDGETNSRTTGQRNGQPSHDLAGGCWRRRSWWMTP